MPDYPQIPQLSVDAMKSLLDTTVNRSYVDTGNHKLVQGNDDPRAIVNNPVAQGGLRLRYPQNLGQPPNDKWMLFEVRSGRHLLRNIVIPEWGSLVDRTLASVALYLPPEALATTIQSAWTTDYSGLGDAIRAAQAAAQAGTSVAKAWETVRDSKLAWMDRIPKAGAEMLKGLIQASESAFSIAGSRTTQAAEGWLGGLVGASLEQSLQAASALTGNKVNPRVETLFDGVQYRDHTLNFTLVPRNRKEADDIDRIVSLFQFYMLPSYGSPTEQFGFLIGFPYEFEIRMFSEYDDLSQHHFNTIGRSVLKSCTINNAPNGTAFIKDGPHFYPAVTMLSMTFQEVRLLGRDSSEIVRGGVQPFEDPRYTPVIQG